MVAGRRRGRGRPRLRARTPAAPLTAPRTFSRWTGLPTEVDPHGILRFEGDGPRLQNESGPQDREGDLRLAGESVLLLLGLLQGLLRRRPRAVSDERLLQ